METISASVVGVEDKYFIKILPGDEEISIPLSEDNPNEVKTAFNRLIARAKVGEFRIELKQVEEHLFSQVAKEYLAQLNQEIQEIRGELKKLGLA